MELMMGLAITTMVMGALASVTYALCCSWRNSDSMQSMFLSGNQAVLRIQNTMRDAKQTGLVRLGSLDGSASGACVMLWLNDTNNDGRIQFSEMGLLQHDPAQKTLTLYSVVFPSNWTVTQQQAADWIASSSDLNSASAPEIFKALNYVNGKKLAVNVTGAQFYVQSAGSTSMKPNLDFTLNITRNGKSQTIYGTAALRGPKNGG